MSIIQESLPLDKLQRQGIALSSDYDEQEISLVSARLDNLFDELRTDRSRYFGACICWAVDLDVIEEQLIDETVQVTADLQNHGMVSKYIKNYSAEHGGALWAGLDQNNGSRFIIAKHHLPIALDDETVALNGVTYSISGSHKE